MTTKINKKVTSRKLFIFSNPPYWLLACFLCFILMSWFIVNDGNYNQIFFALIQGVVVTLCVSLVAFIFAFIFGFVLALGKLSNNPVFRHFASFYIEIIRGVPMLVLLYYVAFVGAPELVRLFNLIFSPLIKINIISALNVRNLDFTWRAILALTIGYSAFIAEIFRAGIESISVGQKEACQSLGLTRWQTMRFVILPQAFRNVLPALGNDFVAILKDSALVSAVGVQDITQLGKVYSASTFLFLETYNVVVFLYLVMTIGLSLLVRLLENYLKKYKFSNN